MPHPIPRATGHRSPVTGHWFLVPALLLVCPGITTAQHDDSRSTRSGVYSVRQASLGGDVYALICASCHTPASHTGPEFTAKWEGRPLGDLFEYVRSSMPKSEPGSLGRREYVQVLAYLLKLNDMPAGGGELPADSLALTKIRIEWKPTANPSRER